MSHSLVDQFAHLVVIAIEVNQTMVFCIVVHLNRFHFAKENAVRADVVHVLYPTIKAHQSIAQYRGTRFQYAPISVGKTLFHADFGRKSP